MILTIGRCETPVLERTRLCCVLGCNWKGNEYGKEVYMKIGWQVVKLYSWNLVSQHGSKTIQDTPVNGYMNVPHEL